MSRFFTIKRNIAIATLTAAWCGLWRDVSVANVLVGTVIAVAVTLPGVATRCQGGVRLVPLGRLAVLVTIDLVKSTISVAREILTPTDRTEESIIAVQLPSESREHLLLLIVAITLTPGTAVVDADPDTATLYLHLLHHDRRDATVAHVEELARLASFALPSSRIGATA